MHLQIPTVVFRSRSAETWIAQDVEHVRPAEKVLPETSTAFDVGSPTADVDGALDGW